MSRKTPARDRSWEKGWGPMTLRELEVEAQLLLGASREEVARQLGISRQTAKNHTTRILDKRGARDCRQLIVRHYQARIRELEGKPGCGVAA